MHEFDLYPHEILIQNDDLQSCRHCHRVIAPLPTHDLMLHNQHVIQCILTLLLHFIMSCKLYN